MRLPEALASLFIAVRHTMFAENIYIVHTFLNWIKPGVNKLIKPKSMSKKKMTKKFVNLQRGNLYPAAKVKS